MKLNSRSKFRIKLISSNLVLIRTSLIFVILLNSTSLFCQTEYLETVSVRRFDPYTNFISHLNHSRKKIVTPENTNWEIHIRNGQISDTLTFNLLKNQNFGQFSFVHCIGGIRNEEIKIDSAFSCTVQANDSIVVKWENSSSIVTKYKGIAINGTIVTIYYSDSLGIIKLYSNNKSLCFENFSKEKDLLNACLKEIYLNPVFHLRYDSEPRTIGFMLVDYDLVLGKGKKKKKKKIDVQYRKFTLKTPCEVGYLNACY